MILTGQEAIDFIEANSKYFKPKEFKCKCGECQGIKIDTDNIARLDYIRETIGVPVIINSAYRCETHNRNVGGSENSYHTKGMAYDITTKDFARYKYDIITAAEEAGFTGIGKSYASFVHVDNGTKRSW